MERAGIAELALSILVNATKRTASGGNAQLPLPSSNNFDISFEYYFGESSLLSGAVFYKDASDFIASNTRIGIFPGYERLGPIPFTRPDTLESVAVGIGCRGNRLPWESVAGQGLDIRVLRFVDFLLAPFGGLDLIAKYTCLDGEDINGFALVATCENSFNLLALYEKGPLAERLACNDRDEAVFEFTRRRPCLIDARSQLDAQVRHDIQPRFVVQLRAQNLTPDVSATGACSVIGPVALSS